MFKREKVGEDILFEMEKNLRKNAFIEETKKTNERIQAMELLEKAANNFEAVGKLAEAEAVTRIIEFVSTKKAEKQISPEQQVKNMKETGTQFPRDMFAAIDGNPTEEEDKLFKEYMNMGLGEEIKVSEASDDELNDHELTALKRLWG